MSATYMRGGIPVHLSGTLAVTTVEKWVWAGGVANFFHFRNKGVASILLSFTLADATASRGITVEGGETLQLPAEVGVFFTYSAAAVAFEATVLLRRG